MITEESFDKAVDRYIHHELLLSEIMDMPWWKRIFVARRKIKKHLQTYRNLELMNFPWP